MLILPLPLFHGVVNLLCLWRFSFPCRMSFCMSKQHVHAAYACLMFLLHVFAACPCCMSMLHVHAACPCYISVMNVHAACPYWMSICPYYMSMSHVHAACPCLMSMLHAHAACPCYMSVHLWNLLYNIHTPNPPSPHESIKSHLQTRTCATAADSLMNPMKTT
jgi:hypothetical protein